MKWIEKNRDKMMFDFIIEGNCFLYYDVLYMKVDAILEMNWNGEKSEVIYNAVNLETGSMIKFDDTCQVIAVDATVLII